LTVCFGSLFLFSLSSAGVVLHEVRAVTTIEEFRKELDSLILANSKRIAAAKAVAALPLQFYLYYLSIIRLTSDAFSSS
jgi:hypothetical protein